MRLLGDIALTVGIMLAAFVLHALRSGWVRRLVDGYFERREKAKQSE
jgi:hypothetical protein